MLRDPRRFACRYKLLPGGRRQIMSFHIPGDIPDLQSLHLEIMDHGLATVVASKVAFIPHDAVRSFLRAHPRIADVFWRDTLIDAAVFREWVVNVGRRDAYARLAHVMCEVYVRLRAIGLVNGQAFEMPITQAELGDATGLSTVHVNRTIQELRGNGLISTPKSGRVVIEDWDRLQGPESSTPHTSTSFNRLPNGPGDASPQVRVRATDEQVNDFDRLGRDPAMLWNVGSRAVMKGAAATGKMGRFETELLAQMDSVRCLGFPRSWKPTRRRPSARSASRST